MIPSLEGLPTKAKEAPSPLEVRLAPLDTNPVFHSLGDNNSLGDNYYFSVITINLVILSSWNLVWVSFLGARNLKITVRLKNKPFLRYLRFQILGTCDWTGAENTCGRIVNEKIFLCLWISTYHWAKNGFCFFSR